MKSQTKINCLNFVMGLMGIFFIVLSMFAIVTISIFHILQLILGCLFYWLAIREYL